MNRFIIGTTSFVFPATIYENCKRLEELVDLVSIVMFETQACLKYTKEDLPKDLIELDLSYNIHLPLDLPWELGAEEVYNILDCLIKKTEFLNPTSYTLHPPLKREDFCQLLEIMKKRNISLTKFFIENIKENDLTNIWDILLENDIKICLDLGHFIEYKQERLFMLDDLMGRIGMLHLYAPQNGRHTSLDHLSKEHTNLLIFILKEIKKRKLNPEIIIEVFDYNDLISSLDFFQLLTREL